MKNTLICTNLSLLFVAGAHAGENLATEVGGRAAADYREKIQKAQRDYLGAMRKLFRDVTAIELLLIEAPKEQAGLSPFDDDWGVARFTVPFSECSYRIRNRARLEKPADVCEFLKAAVPEADRPIGLLPEYPTIGFRCFTGASEVFASTIDLVSQSIEIYYPDGQSSRLGIDTETVRKVLVGRHLLRPTKPKSD